MSWLSRLVNALNPRRIEEDLAEEIQDHLDRRAVALREQGLAADEARQQTQLRFGNATLVFEKSRGMRMWEGLESALQDARYAWRGMRNSPGFAATVVLSLALAIGANTAVYSILDAAILRALPVARPDQLFTLTYPDILGSGSSVPAERTSFSYPEFVQFSSAAKPAASLGLFSSPYRVEARALKPDAPIERINRGYVSGEAFDLLGVRPAAGRLFSAEQDRLPPGRPLAVLSDEYWRRRFGADPAVIGGNLLIDGKAFEIIGVAQKGFFGVEPGRFADIWIPATQYEARALPDPDWYWFRILGRFAPGVSAEQVEARLQPSFHDFIAQFLKRMPTIPPTVRQQALAAAIRARRAPTGVSDFRQEFARPLWIVFGVAADILLIACANVASLLLARATARAPEMAVRVSLGAARIRLIRQMLTESLLLSSLAGALGWLFTRTAAQLLVGALSKHDDPVQLALAVDTRALLYSVLVAAAAAVLFGLAPAWHSSGVDPMRSLRGSSGLSGRLRIGKFFVSVQVACAFCLVVVGAAFVFSLGNLLRVDPGFDQRNVAVLSFTTGQESKSDDVAEWSESHRGERARLLNVMSELRSRVAVEPGVQAAALAWWPIFGGGGWSERLLIPGRAPSEQEEIFYRVSPGYLAALRTPLVAGRDFTASDTAAREPVPAIVNEAFARKYFGGGNVLGREFSYPFGPSLVRQVIVGVAADARYYSLRGSADPIVYVPLEGSNSFILYVRSPLPLAQMMRMVEREARATGPGTQVREVTSLDTLVGNTLLREKLLAGLGGAFAFFGLLLAAIGLFGLLSYGVGRRTKEIGIRMALGAQRRQIISVILKDVAGLTAGGLIAGFGSALAVLTIFRSLLFGLRGIDPILTGTAVTVFFVTGVAAASLPAYRAATIDPMCVLRQE
jgi:predicted permease